MKDFMNWKMNTDFSNFEIISKEYNGRKNERYMVIADKISGH